MQVKFVSASKDTWFAYYGLDPANGEPLHLDATCKVVPNVPSAKPTDALAIMLTTTELANAANSAWCMAKEKFYQDPATNHYSKAVHANTVEGLAYAFQSDDHCNESSYVSLINPDLLTITFVASGQ